jgi:hypothetical protein
MGAALLAALGGGVATMVAFVASGILLALASDGAMPQGERGFTGMVLLMLYAVVCAPYVLAATLVGQWLPRNWPLAVLTGWCPMLATLFVFTEIPIGRAWLVLMEPGVDRNTWAIVFVPLSIPCFCAVGAFAAAHWPEDPARSWRTMRDLGHRGGRGRPS